jgi:hypothetical protein
MKRLYALLLGVGLACTGGPGLADWGEDAFGEVEHRKFDPDRDMQGRRFHPDHDRGTVSRDSWLRQHGHTDFGIPLDHYPPSAAWLPRPLAADPAHATVVVIDLRQPSVIHVTGDFDITTDDFVSEKKR